MYLGHEVMEGSNIPVYAMPRMNLFLRKNEPWSQLVEYNNIELVSQASDSTIHIFETLSVTPFPVPHRDEYSETVGYRIEPTNKEALFIPDINKWEVWDRSVIEKILNIDVAFPDATFFDSKELPDRNMSEIPHPFVEESIKLFQDLPKSKRAKIVFVHFNHRNPLILNSMERKQVENLGFKVAFEGVKINL